MTSSKFKSEIMRKPSKIQIIATTHTKPSYFVHVLGYIKIFKFFVDVIMTSSKFKSEITREP